MVSSEASTLRHTSRQRIVLGPLIVAQPLNRRGGLQSGVYDGSRCILACTDAGSRV